MTRAVTDARHHTTTEWISSPVGAGEDIGPLRVSVSGGSSSAAQESQWPASTTNHEAIGSFLQNKIHRNDAAECWWCSSGRRQSRHQLCTSLRALATQASIYREDMQVETPEGPLG